MSFGDRILDLQPVPIAQGKDTKRRMDARVQRASLTAAGEVHTSGMVALIPEEPRGEEDE